MASQVMYGCVTCYVFGCRTDRSCIALVAFKCVLAIALDSFVYRCGSHVTSNCTVFEPLDEAKQRILRGLSDQLLCRRQCIGLCA